MEEPRGDVSAIALEISICNNECFLTMSLLLSTAEADMEELEDKDINSLS